MWIAYLLMHCKVLDAKGELQALKLHRLGRTSFRAVKTKRDYLQHRSSFRCRTVKIIQSSLCRDNLAHFGLSIYGHTSNGYLQKPVSRFCSCSQACLHHTKADRLLTMGK